MKRDYDFPQFTATKWDSVEQKEKFARQFIRFVESGFKRSLFYKDFYRRLSMSFGMIAHYNQAGFYSQFFEDEEGKREFLREVLSWPCYGQPDYTYCDVERHLQGWLQQYLEDKAA